MASSNGQTLSVQPAGSGARWRAEGFLLSTMATRSCCAAAVLLAACGRASARDGATHEPASVVAGEAVAKTCAQCVHWVASEQGKHALVAMRAHVQSILSTSDEGQQE